jgi:oxygen-independent coproporphyrinogen-3 oxidase
MFRAPVRRASVYVHFPFCLEKCPYCDFVSYKTERAAIDHQGYADAVLRELDRRAPSFSGRTVASVFFGGGTPSLWEPAELGRVLSGIRAALPTAPELEVTVECNPTSLDRVRADALADVGVGRLSIGTQSLRADALRFLGRLHDRDGALAALDAALASRVPRVSTDLIFGLPEQSPEDAAAQAAALAERGLAHLSCYQLTIEPGTRFGELARVGRLPLADDGRVAEAFLAIDEALSARGLAHYEISNYARPGDEARHNLGYWRGEEYLGLGCGAYGFVRTEAGGERWRNETLPARYVERAGTDAAETEREALSPEALLRERIMLGLRLAGGFDLEEAARDVGAEAWTDARRRSAERLASRGRLALEGSRVRIPREAWLFTDDTAARLF